MFKGILKLSVFSSWIILPLVLVCSPNLPGVIPITLISLFLSATFGINSYIAITGSLGSSNKALISKSFIYKSIKYCFFMTLFIAIVGNQHDYILYGNHWRAILDGMNPWVGTGNAYGPIHVLFAPLYGISKVIPKILFFLALSSSIYFSIFSKLDFNNDLSFSAKKLNLLVYGFCPFVVITAALYGNNDALVSALIIYSITIIKSSNVRFYIKSLISGFSLAVASMIKFYPLVVAPVFMIRKRKIDIAFCLSFFSTCFGIALLSYSRWAETIFNPVLFATGRPSKHLSFFNFSRTILNLDFDDYSIYFVVISFIISLIIVQFFKFDLIPAVIITLASVLTMYKVGNQQYYLLFFCITPLLARYLYSYDLSLNKPLIKSYILWLSYLNFYQIQYHLTCGMWTNSGKIFRDYGSIFHVIFSVYLMFQIFNLLVKNRSALSNEK
tara:strand:- start:332 stop:1657 length:1326 start_codon:yes stop_codon:yes gene_type:complete